MKTEWQEYQDALQVLGSVEVQNAKRAVCEFESKCDSKRAERSNRRQPTDQYAFIWMLRYELAEHQRNVEIVSLAKNSQAFIKKKRKIRNLIKIYYASKNNRDR